MTQADRQHLRDWRARFADQADVHFAAGGLHRLGAGPGPGSIQGISGRTVPSPRRPIRQHVAGALRAAPRTEMRLTGASGSHPCGLSPGRQNVYIPKF